jgi:hypothetical protein
MCRVSLMNVSSKFQIPSRASTGFVSTQLGCAVGAIASRRAADAHRVMTAIERSHTRVLHRAVSRPDAIRQVAQRVARERAGGLRSGSYELIKGHFVEIWDVDTSNVRGRLVGKKLVLCPNGRNAAYDAIRIVDGKFAGGVQQKSSASHVAKTIRMMERKKPGSARYGVLRVPQDQVAEATKRARGQIKEVKPMAFTRQEASDRLTQGLKDLATDGTKATSQLRAIGKAGLTGAAVNVALGTARDARGVWQGKLTTSEFVVNRGIDGAEGATGAVFGTLSSGAAVTWTTALVAAEGTALSAGAAAAVPVIAGVGAAVVTGIAVTYAFKRVRGRVDVVREHRRRNAGPAAEASVPEVRQAHRPSAPRPVRLVLQSW